MKINGNDIHRASRIVKIRGLEFVVTAVPIGFEREFDKVYGMPSPPVTEINRAGKLPERQVNYDDPKFLEELKDASYYKQIYLFWKMVKDTPGIQFDTTPADKDTIRMFAKELAQSNLSEGDINLIVRTGVALTELHQEELEEAKKNS